MRIEVGDFVKAKGRKYDDHYPEGFVTAIEGDLITVNDVRSFGRYQCHREGATIIPAVARVVASRAGGWQHLMDRVSVHHRPLELGFDKDRRAYQTLLAGVAASTVTAVQAYIEEHGVEIDSIKVELRYARERVVDLPRVDFGGGAVAPEMGHSTFRIYVDVFVAGNMTDRQEGELNSALVLHRLQDLALLNGRVCINLHRAAQPAQAVPKP